MAQMQRQRRPIQALIALLLLCCSSQSLTAANGQTLAAANAASTPLTLSAYVSAATVAAAATATATETAIGNSTRNCVALRTPATDNAQKSARSEQVQRFPAPRHMTAAAAHKDLVFVILVPSKDSEYNHDCIMPKVLAVLELAIRHVQEQLRFAADAIVDFTLISRDSFCSSTYGPIGFFEIFTGQPEVNAVFGLPCDYVLAPIARYAGVWEVPVLTSGGNAGDFSKKAEYYPTLTRIKGAQMNNLGNVVHAILENFNWTHTSLIYDNTDVQTKGNSVCYFCIVVVHEKIKRTSVAQQAFEKKQLTRDFIVRMLRKISLNTRVVIMCADPESIRKIMLTAEELNMIESGEYVFINIELFSRVPHITSQPWKNDSDTEETNERARKAYTAMLTVTPKQPNDDEYMRVSNEIKDIAAKKFNYTSQDNEPISAFVTSFFDGVLLYANALNDSIREDPTVLTRPINGTDMVRRMWNRSFKGITGNVTIDANGDRISAYSLLDMNPETGRFEIVADFLHNQLEFVPGKKIHWAGDRLDPPPDTPLCGYDGSQCPDNSLPGYAILSMILGGIVVLMMVGFAFGYRHYKSEAEINSMVWKVSLDDVFFADGPGGRCFRGSIHSLVKQNSQVTLMSEDMGSFSGDRQIFIPLAVYRGCKVAIKYVDVHNVNLTRSLMLELKRMKDLQHDHLVKFYGACLNPAKSFLLTEYCPKGSLQDILENDQFQLDWMFKLSLMHDIVRGMQFLHNSDIKSHGNLKSSNCVVDSRFVLKITDFGLHSLRHQMQYDDYDEENCRSHAYWSKFLWTAPELLKMEANRPPEGTQKGDVYSFGIIVHEITTRQGPFYLGKPEQDISPKDIIELVKRYPNKMGQPFRPHIDVSNSKGVTLDIVNMMTKCWSEDPIERPDFNAVKTIIRKINKDNETGNIVDNLLKRMEQYANNLEGLVEERTQDYLEEKKKCEKLLYQLLPQSVAAQLISGQPVIAETFDQVTIYFSDIVGFTAISAESTPMQVVQFLNDLYTCFDSIVENFDVYKVETIGDAYMVVSGLPIRNGNRHAREIARLALALLQAVHNFTIRHRPDDKLRLRIGLHTGACVAGVVGLKMPRYCLFGDTVNTASRMESNGEALKIHISEKTKSALDEFGTFVTTRRGFVPMKGKGEMLTYWLEGEVPKTESPIPPHKLLISRRSSLKQPTSKFGTVYKLEPSSVLPPHVKLCAQEHTRSNQASRQTSPNLRVKRKISSSSPKLNIGGFGGGDALKTEDLSYYLDTTTAARAMAPPAPATAAAVNTNELAMATVTTASRLNKAMPGDSGAGGVTPITPTIVASTHDGNWELANFRLPLSGTLKNCHSSNLKCGGSGSGSGNYTPLLSTTNSSSNLSGILQPVAVRMKLKQSPTISSLVQCAARPDGLDNCSVHSGNRIKFYNMTKEPLDDTEKLNPTHESDVEDDDIDHHNGKAAVIDVDSEDSDDDDKPNVMRSRRQRCNGSNGSRLQIPLLESNSLIYNNITPPNGATSLYNGSNSSNGSANYNNIVKANNVKNFKMSNSFAADEQAQMQQTALLTNGTSPTEIVNS